MCLRTETRYNAKVHHYALQGGVLHKVHAVPRRTTQVPRCSTEANMVQTVCYTYRHTVQHKITRITPCKAGYYTMYTRYRCSTEVHTVQTVCYAPTHSTTRNYTITHCTAGYYTKYTLDYSGTYGTLMC